jgi:YggT family protein
MGIICVLLWVYFVVLLARVLSSWFPIPPRGPWSRIVGFVYDLTEPVLRPLRNLLPPLRMGAMGLDLSPIIVFVVMSILINVFCAPG